MNSLSNLSRKNLKVHKLKNILVIIAIMLSTCLISTICILSYSLQQMEIKQIVAQTGDLHVEYANVSEKQVEILKNNKKLTSVNEYIGLGFNNQYKPYSIEMCYIDESAGDTTDYFRLKEGKWPEKEQDIAMPKWMLEKMGVKPKIGEKVTLSYSQDMKAYSYEGKGDFVVCGILDDSELMRTELYKAMAIVSKDYIFKNVKPEQRFIQASAKVKGRNISDTAYEIGHNIGLGDKNISVNKMYINALGLSKDVLIPAGIAGVIVVLATVLVIYNIFYISIKERITQFGLLAALGTTKKQIRRVIFREGLILSFIGIPGGIILGHLLSLFIIPLIPLTVKLTLETSPYIVILSAFVSLVTVAISLRKPSKIASKVSPIEAIRYSSVELSGGKKERKAKGTTAIRRLAYLNLWRSKKRTIVTIISMSLTGILFIVFFSMFSSIKNKQDNHISSDFELTASWLTLRGRDDGSDPLNKETLSKVKKIKGIEKVDILKQKELFTSDIRILKKCNEVKRDDMPEFSEINCNFFGFEDSMLDELKRNLLQGEISKESLKNKDEVIMVNYNGENHTSGNPLKVGDKVVLENKSIKREFTIAAIVSYNTRWLGYTAGGPQFITHEASYSRILKDDRIGKLCIDINNDSYNSVKKSLESILKGNDNAIFFDRKEYKQKQDLEYKGMGLAVVSLISIIGLIGILNSINTMFTSIMTRKKEFGMMEAVGLSKTQLRKLLQIEGLYYCGISIIVSVVLGVLVSYILYLNMDFMRSSGYKIPFVPIILVSAAFICIQGIITYIGERFLRKESVIDRVRYNE
ncbi:ABC transporter permease [Clostridiaceae bacterium UIB06]|uniref:ABC transporter permease n=1 Tax=Clostridium thailandense TaxID=2794346 RepID=A0A949U2E8_9CLOT|nr:ABC transporter permease [Clostridium thailandense]MBV7275233.1 ABC transporter permease [Clostridium thailandense]MCH5137744.1 ABC transporter permease [Clostridiaceae bacterium UIB06]